MTDAFDTDVAKRMPRTKPRRPWHIKASEDIDRKAIDNLSKDTQAKDRLSMDSQTIDNLAIDQHVLADVPDLSYINDRILPTLDPKSQLVYMRLHRLSYGDGRDVTEFIGYTALARLCGISPKSVYRAIRDLLNGGFILIVERHKAKGTRYRLRVPDRDNSAIDK